METGIPAWLPDWKDDNAYPRCVDDWSINQWMWAFIRRNEEYRADYAHFASLPSYRLADDGYSVKSHKWAGRSGCLGESMSMRYCEPPALPRETLGQYYARLKGKIIEVEMPLEGYLMEKWRIGNLPDPANDLGYRILTPSDDRPPERLFYLDYAADGESVRVPERGECCPVTLCFDLRFSIDRQIERAKEILMDEKSRQKEGIEGITDFEEIRASAPKESELIRYLRAFDARSAGAKYKEIGARLYPEKNNKNSGPRLIEKSAKDAADAGRRLVEGGYKAILNFAA